MLLSPMSLRYQLLFRILLLSIFILLLGGGIAIWQARKAVGKEVDASIHLVLQLISLGLVDIPDLHSGAGGFSALRQTRHLSIELKQADGRLIPLTENAGQSDAPENMPPAWFIRAVQTHNRRLEHYLQTRDGQPLTLVIQAQPLDEIQEVWEESLAFFVSISLLTLLTFIAVNLVLNRSLRSIGRIVDVLKAIEDGDYTRQLPSFATREFDSIAGAINHMTGELDRGRRENRALTQHSLAIQEEERKHLAQELHDEFGQSLTAIKVMSVMAARRSSDTVEIGQTISDSCDHLMTVLRGMMQQLHPLMLSELGLRATLEDTVNRWRERQPELHLAIECDEEADHLPSNMAIQVFRVIQECLTNILRHAEAQQVRINLMIDDNRLRLTVEDDGRGCELDQIQHGFGLRGMQERIRSLGGELQVVSAPSAGMRIAAWVPLS